MLGYVFGTKAAIKAVEEVVFGNSSAHRASGQLVLDAAPLPVVARAGNGNVAVHFRGLIFNASGVARSIGGRTFVEHKGFGDAGC